MYVEPYMYIYTMYASVKGPKAGHTSDPFSGMENRASVRFQIQGPYAGDSYVVPFQVVYYNP